MAGLLAGDADDGFDEWDGLNGGKIQTQALFNNIKTFFLFFLFFFIFF